MTDSPPSPILNVLPSRETDKDWDAGAAHDAGALNLGAAVPDRWDLRDGNAWWQIGNQRDTGACVGWATADGLLRYQLVQAQRIAPSQRLSVRFLWMASKETDDYVERPTTFVEEAGTRIKSALDVAQRFGCVPDAMLPSDGTRLYTGNTAVFYTTAARYRIASYHNLTLDRAGNTLDLWKLWIRWMGPIAVRLDVDDAWMAARDTGGRLDAYDRNHVHGGHAVALVGYTPEHFVVRNSWGTTLWGDQGYGYASPAYAAAAFTEAYGVTL
jgi:hypothetical protein